MIYTLVLLGNPGEKYTRTRHNAARVVMEYIQADIDTLSLCEVFIPDTFMNDSGKAVSEYFRYHEDREIVVVYDDKDIPFGTLRISYDRGDGGHNGLKSIIESIGKKDFIRIRIGVAPKDVDGKEVLPPSGDAVQKYVLGHITDEEEVLLRTVSPTLLASIKTITEESYVKAMERYN